MPSQKAAVQYHRPASPQLIAERKAWGAKWSAIMKAIGAQLRAKGE